MATHYLVINYCKQVQMKVTNCFATPNFTFVLPKISPNLQNKKEENLATKFILKKVIVTI